MRVLRLLALLPMLCVLLGGLGLLCHLPQLGSKGVLRSLPLESADAGIRARFARFGR